MRRRASSSSSASSPRLRRDGSVSSVNRPTLDDPNHSLLRKWSHSSIKVAAATSLQAAMRGRMARKRYLAGDTHREVEAERQRREQAATTVQAAVRGHKARTEVNRLKARRKAEARARAIQRRRERRERAAIKWVYGPDGRRRTEEEDRRIRDKERQVKEAAEARERKAQRRKEAEQKRQLRERRRRQEALRRKRMEDADARQAEFKSFASPIRVGSGVPRLPSLSASASGASPAMPLFLRTTGMRADDLAGTGSQTARGAADGSGTGAQPASDRLPQLPHSARATTDHRRGAGGGRRFKRRGRRHRKVPLGRPTVFSAHSPARHVYDPYSTGDQGFGGGYAGTFRVTPRSDSLAELGVDSSSSTAPGGFALHSGPTRPMRYMARSDSEQQFQTRIEQGENVMHSASRRRLPRRPARARRYVVRAKPVVDSHWQWDRQHKASKSRLVPLRPGGPRPSPRDHTDYIGRYLRNRKSHHRRSKRHRMSQASLRHARRQQEVADAYGGPVSPIQPAPATGATSRRLRQRGMRHSGSRASGVRRGTSLVAQRSKRQAKNRRMEQDQGRVADADQDARITNMILNGMHRDLHNDSGATSVGDDEVHADGSDDDDDDDYDDDDFDES